MGRFNFLGKLILVSFGLVVAVIWLRGFLMPDAGIGHRPDFPVTARRSNGARAASPSAIARPCSRISPRRS